MRAGDRFVNANGTEYEFVELLADDPTWAEFLMILTDDEDGNRLPKPMKCPCQMSLEHVASDLTLVATVLPFGGER